MAEKDLRRMNRAELIEIIYAQQQTTPDTGSTPTLEEVEEEKHRLEYHRRFRRSIRTTIYALIVVAAISILLATMFLPVLRVSGRSMEPTLYDQDIIVLVRNGQFKTGDLVGFYYQNKLLLKRVIGGPGDVIDIDADGNVTVNDEPLDEPYITDKALGETDRTYPYQVPENRYFVMGDNRETSIDSRSSAIGCIEKDQILGEVALRVWPFGELSLIH